jgi:4-aminobutyrate aminotransferase-like enzyme
VGYAGKASYRQRLGVGASAQFVPFPDATRDADASETLSLIERVIDRAGGAGAPAAILLEPVQGNGGVVIPPADLLPGLRAICDRTGALLILDEIQSGCGRTGTMWASQQLGAAADLVTVGKGIGGGLAVAAVYGTDEAMAVLDPDAYSSTFLTNNLNQAAAVAAIGILRDDELPARAGRLGREILLPALEAIAALEGVGTIRTIGLWAGIPLHDGDGQPDGARAARVVKAARAAGVVVGRGGYHDEVVKLSPPLVIDDDDLSRALELLADVIGVTR